MGEGPHVLKPKPTGKGLPAGAIPAGRQRAFPWVPLTFPSPQPYPRPCTLSLQLWLCSDPHLSPGHPHHTQQQLLWLCLHDFCARQQLLATQSEWLDPAKALDQEGHLC